MGYTGHIATTVIQYIIQPLVLVAVLLKAENKKYDTMSIGKEAFKGDIRDPSYQHTIPIEFNGLRRSRSQEELKKEYRKLARKLHPDKGGSTSMFQRLQNLYERLCVSFV